ncbi:glycosyltransferase [Poriferisphaera sp. WC338]|uniref:glycosyltransferase n=1 Tax=Poriferisphaera sp. WC338 TaxID=3425129 RepID=UPI003D8174F3
MPKPKVLHVRVVSNAGGGPDKTILRQPKHMNQHGFDVHAAYIYPAGDEHIHTIEHHAAKHHCPLHLIPEKGALDPSTISRLIQLCKKLRIDIWHAHDYKTDVLGLIVNRFHHMKLVSSVHGFIRETWKTRLYSFIDGLSLLFHDRVLTVSPDLTHHCGSKGVHPSKLRYVPNAIDLSEYDLSDNAFKLQTIDDDTINLGVISRFSTEKGVDRTLQLHKLILDAGYNAVLHLVGDGPELDHLKQLADKLDTQSHIKWWGWQEEPRQFYCKFDALLLTSHTEGLPNVLLEAMTMYVPVIATNVGGVSELLGDGEFGVLLNNHDTIEAWYQPIQKLLNCNEYRRELAHRAHAQVHDHYTFEKRVSRIESIYRELLAA